MDDLLPSAPLLAAAESPADGLVWSMAQLLDRLPVGRSTVYRWIEHEGLPVIRIGKGSSPLFLPESVLRWLKSREQQKEVAHALTGGAEYDAMRLAGLRQTARRSRRKPPPPLATAGSRERLRRIHGAR